MTIFSRVGALLPSNWNQKISTASVIAATALVSHQAKASEFQPTMGFLGGPYPFGPGNELSVVLKTMRDVSLLAAVGYSFARTYYAQNRPKEYGAYHLPKSNWAAYGAAFFVGKLVDAFDITMGVPFPAPGSLNFGLDCIPYALTALALGVSIWSHWSGKTNGHEDPNLPMHVQKKGIVIPFPQKK